MLRKRAVLVLSTVALVVVAIFLAQLAPFSSPRAVAKTQTTPTPTSMLVATIPAATPIAVNDAAKSVQAQVEAVYQAAGEAVVNITAQSTAYDFFMNPVPQAGTGSGFVYDDQGHIVTNFHVIENANKVVVTLADGRTLDATIVGQDPSNDLAVLQIKDENRSLRPIALADSSTLSVGQFVVAIGNPFGLERTLTFGVISSLGRIIQSPDGRFIGQAIQTDAAINPGNSGGPLLDLQGRVIGINSQIISPSRSNAGIGFAIPVNTVKLVVPELITHGYYRHPWIGAQFLELTPQRTQVLAEAGVKGPDKGLLLLEITPGSAADKAGLRGGQRIVRLGDVQLPLGGDVLVAIDGQEIASLQDLTVYLEMHTQVGDAVQVTVLRDGKRLTASLTLQERPAQ
ncbi:MAG: trypsin-like serine protease [Chloroflexi bacterium]|nr:trypsin-like serine protease [Chloroflexota bacterium]